MSGVKRSSESTRYTIIVRNHLDLHWEHWFDGMTISHTGDGETILSGEVADQSALYGLLEQLRNLNLTLIYVKREE